MYSRTLAIVALLLSAAPALGKIGTLDNVPGATLLFPHFEVDTQNPNGVDTLIAVQNASATAMLVNATLWTDYGLPTTHFLMYLTGYDQQTIDLGNLFRRVVPVTASAGQDPSDTISPKGVFSQDINFASCTGILPTLYGNGATIGPDLVAAHSGSASVDYFGGNCGSFNYGDGIARGYVTVDTVNNCTQRKPGNAGYFAPGGSGDVTNQNTLVGDWILVDSTKHRVLADTAVAIEASASDPLTSSIGSGTKYTFYARFVGNLATDNREPLPTAWAGFDSASRTSIDAWRDPGVSVSPFTCGTTPAPYPLGQKLVTAFDANGGTTPVTSGNHFPLAAGNTPDSALGTTASFGWLFLNLNLPAPNGPLADIRQSWVTFRQTPRGVSASSSLKYAAPGTQLGNAAFMDSPIIP